MALKHGGKARQRYATKRNGNALIRGELTRGGKAVTYIESQRHGKVKKRSYGDAKRTAAKQRNSITSFCKSNDGNGIEMEKPGIE